ncbi:MAG: DUF5956 family protein [Micropruina sp.]|uniref:DUF5956 family protein n=1 Tax=Micropruina sp. TaxID=2737536 RepID=UPI0039E3D688
MTWDDRIIVGGAGLYLLPDNGYGALIAWLGGAGRTLRAIDRNRGDRIVKESVDGVVTERPITGAELSECDDMVDDYLAEAGVPPRPRGYLWFTTVDLSHLDRELSRRIPPNTVVYPEGMADHIRDVIGESRTSE